MLVSNINKISFHSLFFFRNIEALWIFLRPRTWMKVQNENHIHKFIFCDHRSDCPILGDFQFEIAWEADFHNRSFFYRQIQAINIKYNLLESNFLDRGQFMTTVFNSFISFRRRKIQILQRFQWNISWVFLFSSASGHLCNRLIYQICCGLLCLRHFHNEWKKRRKIEKPEKWT